MAKELIFILVYCLGILVVAAIITLFVLCKDRQHLGILSEKDLEKIRQQAKKEFFRKNKQYLKNTSKREEKNEDDVYQFDSYNFGDYFILVEIRFKRNNFC